MGRNFFNIKNNLSPSTLRNINSVLLGATRGKGSSSRINNFIINNQEQNLCKINNWTNILNKQINWERLAISFNGQIQTAVVYGGNIYISIDYGQTWKPSNQNFNLNWLCVSMSSDGKFQTAIAQDSHIYLSNDYGQTWLPNTTTSNKNGWSYICLSETGKYQTAVVNGYDNGENHGYIYGSSDYGNTWNIMFPYNNCWTSISMSNSGQYQTAVSLSIDGIEDTTNVMGYVFNSNNYGQTWTKNTSLPLSFYTSVGISGSGQIQLVSINNCNTWPAIPGPLLISYDFGVTFNKTSCPYDNWLNISLNNSGNIILASSYQQTDQQNNIIPNTGKMMVSYNYGKSWNQIEVNLNTWTSSIISKDSCIASATAWGSGIYIKSLK